MFNERIEANSVVGGICQTLSPSMSWTFHLENSSLHFVYPFSTLFVYSGTKWSLEFPSSLLSEQDELAFLPLCSAVSRIPFPWFGFGMAKTRDAASSYARNAYTSFGKLLKVEIMLWNDQEILITINCELKEALKKN